MTDYYMGEVREPGPQLSKAAVVGEKMKHALERLRVEQFWVLLLDGKNRILDEVMVSQGSLSASVVHPREVFLPAITASAGAIIAVHNHPSGDPAPSREDTLVAGQLKEAGKILGVPVLDFIIVGSEGWRSMAEEGIL